MDNKRNILERMTLAANLPGEAIPGQPLLEIIGENRILIENHLGVCRYSNSNINIKVRFGAICVCGQNLMIVHITKHQIVITGRIESVSLVRGM